MNEKEIEEESNQVVNKKLKINVKFFETLWATFEGSFFDVLGGKIKT